MNDDSNRREYLRAPIELRVEYTQLNSFLADYTRNISKGGTFIRTQSPLDVGTEFVFRLTIPGLAEPLTLRGQVRWIRREGEADQSPPGEALGAGPGMGIRFLYQNDSERTAIQDTVERLVVDSLGPHLYRKLLGK
jgi:type IV pilus assembly protein PilZ